MLPQDPLLFSGSVRANLDPWEEHSDETIWSALERAQIAAAIHALEPGQDNPSRVREEGLASVTQAVFVDQTPMQGAGADVPFSDLIAQVSRMVGLDHDHERSAPHPSSPTVPLPFLKPIVQ